MSASPTADLRTMYLDFELQSPIVASASPLTGSLSRIVELRDAGVGAVVLPSLFQEQLEFEAFKFGCVSPPLPAGASMPGWFSDVDTYNSAWGKGWRRINSFLSHRVADGSFCDQLWPNRFGRTNSPGFGTKYRAIADGPGVTPVLRWLGPPPGKDNYSFSAGTSTRDQIGTFSITGWIREPYDLAAANVYRSEQRALFPRLTDRCYRTW